MKAIIEFLNSLIDAIVLDSAMTSGEARDMLRAATNGVSVVEASAWLGRIFQVYAMIGVINNATWASWRNEIINEGSMTPKALVDHIANKLRDDAQLTDVNSALRFKEREDALAQLNLDIAAVVVAKDAENDLVLKDALRRGIAALREDRDALKGRLAV
jgi:hypothetical protein